MTVYVGDLLTATAASVTGKPTPSRTWKWLRDGTAISGATSSSYTITDSDLDAILAVEQTETNVGGVARATSSTVGPVATYSPAGLFALAEPGVWYDPSDLTTLFQDTAGTTPVTAAGQPVGRILDKSGRGNHATQSTAASRPTYQIDGTGRPYLSFDGVDDFLVTPTITPGTDKMQVFAGVRKLSDAAFGIIAEVSADVNSNSGSFNLSASPPNVTRATYGLASRGSILAFSPSPATFAAPISNVLTGFGDISGDLTALRINATQVAQTTTDQGTGNFLAYPLYIGRRGGTTSPFNGQLYSLIVRFGANLDQVDINRAERWVADKTGVTL